MQAVSNYWLALLLGIPVTAVTMLVFAALYRLRVQDLMARNSDTSVWHPSEFHPDNLRTTRSGSVHENIRAREQLGRVIVLACFAIGFTSAAFAHDIPLLQSRSSSQRASDLLLLLYFGLRESWLAVPALGLLRRWSALRTIVLTTIYLVGVGAEFWLTNRGGIGFGHWRNLILGPGQLMVYVVVLGSRRFRGVGPYLLPVCIPTAWVIFEVFRRLLAALDRSWTAGQIAISVAVVGTGLVAVLVAIMLAWVFLRMLAWAYKVGACSDLLCLVGIWWLIDLAFTASISKSWPAMLAMLWLPVVFFAFHRVLRPSAEPPNLLVLRVFRHESGVSALFDSVVERWRSSGTVHLLAGTDLALRTLDPQRLFACVRGRLSHYVIADQESLRRRLAASHERPDPDGRFRIFEFLCFEGAWQAAFNLLLERADSVLMDLRGLRGTNLGSLHELRVLAQAEHLNRAVLLVDEDTDLAAAYEALGARPPWIAWEKLHHLNRRDVDRILELLLYPRIDQHQEWPAPKPVRPVKQVTTIPADFSALRLSPATPRLPLRFLGRVLDWVFFFVAQTVLYVTILLVSDRQLPLYVLNVSIVVVLVSQICQLHWWGGTIGMLLTGSRVVSLRSGNWPSWGQSVVRFGFQVLGWSTCGAGSVLLALSPLFDDAPDRRQGWHDRMAKTLVVRREPRVRGGAQQDTGEMASAPLRLRFVGRMLDWVFLVLALYLVYLMSGYLFYLTKIRLGGTPLIFPPSVFYASLVVVLVSQICQLHWWGGTIGMLLTGSRVMSLGNGSRPSWGQSVVRFGFQVLGWLTFGVGSVLLALSPLFDDLPDRRQGWHDRMAKTLVVRRRRPRVLRMLSSQQNRPYSE